MFAYNKIKDEIDADCFAEQAKRNRILEYSNDEFMVRVPMTPQDVIQEATAQHNCLRSYLTRIKEGASRVVFIRKKDEPDRAYVTAEVNAYNHLVQVKGFANSNPTGAKLRKFIADWKRVKALT